MSRCRGTIQPYEPTIKETPARVLIVGTFQSGSQPMQMAKCVVNHSPESDQRKNNINTVEAIRIAKVPTPELPELLNRTRSVTSVMVVGERQNLNLPFMNRFKNFDALSQIRLPV
jgi:hypothetical protein